MKGAEISVHLVQLFSYINFYFVWAVLVIDRSHFCQKNDSFCNMFRDICDGQRAAWSNSQA